MRSEGFYLSTEVHPVMFQADDGHNTYHCAAYGKCVYKQSSFLQALPRRNTANDSVAVARAVCNFAGTWDIKSRSGTCAGSSAKS